MTNLEKKYDTEFMNGSLVVCKDIFKEECSWLIPKGQEKGLPMVTFLQVS